MSVSRKIIPWFSMTHAPVASDVGFFAEGEAVSVVEEESPYNPEFMEMVLDSYKNNKRTVIVNPNDIGESLGK